MSDTTFEDQGVDTAREQAIDTPLEQAMNIPPEQTVDALLEQAVDTVTEQTVDTPLEQIVATLMEQRADTLPEQAAATATEQASDASQEQTVNRSLKDGADISLVDGEQGLGQIDLSARNAEIYRKCKQGYIHAQLSREYSLSPEWIRRICEDEERRQRKNKGEGRMAAGAGTSAAAKAILSTTPTEPLYMAVVEQGQTPRIFHCQRGKVIREMTGLPPEIDTLIRQCLEHVRSTAEESEQNR